MSSFNPPSPENQPQRDGPEGHLVFVSTFRPIELSLEGLTPEQVARQLAHFLIQRNGPLPLSPDGVATICNKYSEAISSAFSTISDRLDAKTEVTALYGCLSPDTEATLVFQIKESGSDERIAVSSVGNASEITTSPLFCGMLLSFADTSDETCEINSRPVLDPRLYETEYRRLVDNQRDCFLLRHINLSAEEKINRIIPPAYSNGEKEFLLGVDESGNSYLIHMLFYEQSGELLHPIFLKLGDSTGTMDAIPDRTGPSDSLVDCFRAHMKMREMDEIDISREEELVEHIKQISEAKLREVLGDNAVPDGCSIHIESIFASSSHDPHEGVKLDSYQILVGVCDEDLNYYLPGDLPVKSPTFAGHILRIKVTETWSPEKESIANHLQSLRWWVPIPEKFMGLFDTREVVEVSGYEGSLLTSNLMQNGLASLGRLEASGCFYDCVMGKARECLKRRGLLDPHEDLSSDNMTIYFQEAPFPDTRGLVVLEHRLGVQVMEIDLNFPFSYFNFVDGVNEAAFFSTGPDGKNKKLA